MAGIPPDLFISIVIGAAVGSSFGLVAVAQRRDGALGWAALVGAVTAFVAYLLIGGRL